MIRSLDPSTTLQLEVPVNLEGQPVLIKLSEVAHRLEEVEVKLEVVLKREVAVKSGALRKQEAVDKLEGLHKQEAVGK